MCFYYFFIEGLDWLHEFGLGILCPMFIHSVAFQCLRTLVMRFFGLSFLHQNMSSLTLIGLSMALLFMSMAIAY